MIVVQPGEKVPIDGIIVEGASSLNTSALTGESLPREAKVGDEVISGCISMTGVLKIQTTKRSLGNPRFLRFWIWWKMQVPANQNQKILSRNLQKSILLLSAMQHWRWRFFPPVVRMLFMGLVCGLGCLDLPGIDIPCYQLSLCACNQYSIKFLCRNRRRKQGGRAGEGFQLSGNPLPDKVCCF